MSGPGRLARILRGDATTRLDRQLQRINRQARRLDRLEQDQHGLAERLQKVQRTVDEWVPLVGNARTMLHVLEHQVGGIETRLADLGELITPTAPLDDTHRAEAVDVLAEVRAEHRRVRARLKLLASYEERIRRLEAVARVTLDAAPFEVDAQGRRRDG